MNNMFSDLLLCSYRFMKYYWRTCTDGFIFSHLFSAPLYIAFLSIFFLVLDRCSMVCYPFKYLSFINGKKSISGDSFLVAFYLRKCSFIWRTWRGCSWFSTLEWNFFWHCSCLLYIITIHHLIKKGGEIDEFSKWKQTRRQRNGNAKTRTKPFQEKSFLHAIILVTCLCVLVLSPLLVFNLVNVTRGYGDSYQERVHMLYFLFYSNFVMN